MTESEAIRVLIVDDNPAIHRDFAKVLRPAVGDTDELAQIEAELFGPPAESLPPATAVAIANAEQGEQAIALVAEAVERGEPYAVAFVDVRMPPGMDGVETAERLWQIDPSLQVVICTAYSDHSWVDLTRRLGASDGLLVLKKPFDAIEVHQMVHALGRKWLLGRQVRRQLDNLETMVAARTRELRDVNEELEMEVEARRKAAQELERMATHDALTGLPNRLLLHDRIESAATRARRTGRKVGVMLIDLDGFKEVNDAYGHDAGDALLRTTADRIRDSLRACDTVARLGGDEFVVVVEGVDQCDDLGIVADRIRARCSAPFQVDGHRVASPPSIGIVVCPDDADDPETLLKCADLAMYRAKEKGGGGYAFFNAEMLASSVERVTIRQELERALGEGELVLHYQPLQRLSDGRVSGMEALLRWQHPERGLVPPMSFIPEAERSGLIVPIGTWVLETACRQVKAWQDGGWGDLTVAVNVSARQLRVPSFVDTVRAALEGSGLRPSLLELEITESVAFEDFAVAKEVLAAVADLGVRILIDDFGSGYSSLNRLKSLPVHGLKIDRFFVQNIADDPQSAAIVMAVVSMAHSFGIEVVAEGIETAEQLSALRAMEWPQATTVTCDRVQGFFLGRPVPAEELEQTLRRLERELQVA